MSRAGIREVLHPVIVTGDLPRALAFYRDLLGMRVMGEMHHDPLKLARLGGPEDARVSAVVLEAANGSEIEIACFERPRGRAQDEPRWPDAGIRSITFVVDDLAALVEHLAQAGYPSLGEIVPFSVDGAEVQAAYVRGPDSIVLTFVERISA